MIGEHDHPAAEKRGGLAEKPHTPQESGNEAEEAPEAGAVHEPWSDRNRMREMSLKV